MGLRHLWPRSECHLPALHMPKSVIHLSLGVPHGCQQSDGPSRVPLRQDVPLTGSGSGCINSLVGHLGEFAASTAARLDSRHSALPIRCTDRRSSIGSQGRIAAALGSAVLAAVAVSRRPTWLALPRVVCP